MKPQDEHKYDDMMMLPHHCSKKHPQMSLLNRAAQFAPFAALTGHDAAIRETARQTDSFVELDENRKNQLDKQLWIIRENLNKRLEIKITYFLPDEKKSGGSYEILCGRVKKIDECRHQILFTDGTALPIENIFSIEGELFRNMDWLDT